MKIFYWAPFLSKIATVSSVVSSINSIKKYSKNEVEISIIDSVGEWECIAEKTKGIKIIKLFDKNIYNALPKKGFVKSRFSQIYIFFFSFLKLCKLIKKHKPDYIMAHLLVSVPLMVMFFLKTKTKLILRISGLPKLNFARTAYWKFFSKNVFKVTCPTIATYQTLKLSGIFNKDIIEILYDPIISPQEIITNKKEAIDENFKGKKFIIGIGRLAKQKNSSLLIKGFNKIKIKYPNLNLIILGEGEEERALKALIKKFNIEKSVHLLGYKKNIYKYLKNAECFILSSLWEDPGFVLVESAFLNIPIISSNCKNGPLEIIKNNQRGFLFENNSLDNLVTEFKNFKNSSNQEIRKKIYNAKLYTKNYTKFYHFLKIKKILDLEG